MAEGNPLLDKIKRAEAEGYSKEEIIAELKRVGKYDSQAQFFLEGGTSEQTPEVKKKSPSQSTLGMEFMDSQLGISPSGSSVSVRTDDIVKAQGVSATEETPFVVNQRKKSALGSEMSRISQEQAQAVAEWRKYKSGEKKLEEPIKPFAIPNQPQDYVNPLEASYQEQFRRYQLELEIANAADADEVRNIILLRNSNQLNNSYRDAYGLEAVPFGNQGDEKNNLVQIKQDESGKIVPSINEGNMSTSIIDVEKTRLIEQKMVEEEQAKLEGKSFVGHLGYDFATGVMDMTNSFQAIWDREQAQTDIYENTMRTQASYLDYGLTNDEIEKGIVQNIIDGNVGAASKIFAVQSAQTTPQLLAQAGVAYATGGVGLSANASMWASSLFMGTSTFGRTWADTYGFVSDEKAFTMALGDALVETISEKLFDSDVKALSGLGNLTGMTRQQIRRQVFGKGLLSAELRKIAKEKGIDIIKDGGEEAVEELFAGVASGMIHSAVNNEEFNIFEALDGAIIGFGMGSGAKSVANSRTLLTAGVSSLGFGGLRSEITTYKNARQSLAKELSETTDDAKQATLEAKIKGLDKTIASIGVDMQDVYNQYSDEDANQTISLNQRLSNTIAKIRQEQNPEVKKALQLEAKNMLTEIQSIESKYDSVRADLKKQRQQIKEKVEAQEQDSVEIDENYDDGGIQMFKGIKTVAQALAGKSKVFIHKTAEAAAKTAGVEMDEVLGSSGFYKQSDGTIHIIPSMAQNNTAYHEGMHKVARSIDSKFIERFVDASMNGMDDATRAKYEEIQEQHKGDKQLMYEEMFAEMAADITDGTISIENQGTSVARAGMKVLGNVMRTLGMNITKTPTLADFNKFVNEVTTDLKEGREAIEAPEGVRTTEKELGSKETLNQPAKMSEEDKAIELEIKKEMQELSTNVDDIVKLMNKFPLGVLNWTKPRGTSDVVVNPIEMSIVSEKITKEMLDELGYSSKEQLVNTLEHFNGMKMMPVMSDFLAAGTTEDSMGKPMKVNGGIFFNLFGVGRKYKAAWAGVRKDDAKLQVKEAVDLYNSDKEHFEKLWAEGKLPYGHVPAVVMRMADTAINSNEAVFRWFSPKIKTYPEENRINALNEIKNAIQAKINAINYKKENAGSPILNEDGTQELKDDGTPKVVAKVSALDKQQLAGGIRLLNAIEKNNITTLDGLFDFVSLDASERAKSGFNKKQEEAAGHLMLQDKTLLFELINRKYEPNGYKTKSKLKPFAQALFEGQIQETELFTANNVFDKIAEPSVLKVGSNHTLAIVGIDVLNPEVIKVPHENYGFGPKGRFISFISNPKHGADVFPEWKSKLSRLKKSLKVADSSILQQVGSTFFGDKVFRGKKLVASEKISDIDLLVGKMRFAFPSVSVTFDGDVFNNIVKNENALTYKSNDNVVIYGITKNGRIYLNPSEDAVNTPIHEFGHIWLDFLESKQSGKTGDELLSRGLELIKGTEYHKKAIKKYGDTNDSVREALVDAIASKGEAIYEASKKSKFSEWMYGMFKFIKDSFEYSFSQLKSGNANISISKISLDDFVNLSLKELFSGKTIDSKFAPEKSESSAKSRFSLFTNDGKTLLYQSGVFKEISDMLSQGKKKSEVIADLRERGISKVEAELIYQKALGYKQGMNQGRKAGRAERSAAYAEARKEQRAKESDEAKAFRKRVKEIYRQEGKLNDAFIREFIKHIKELGNAKLKANQVERIIRIVNAAGKVRGRKAYEPSLRYAAFNKLVDKLAMIIDGAIDAQALVDYANQLKRVTSIQKELKSKLKSVSATSRSPLVSYSEAILDLTSIDPTVISMESLNVLESALNDLKNTARNVSVRKGELSSPYIFIEELGENIDTRRAKIYFSEIFDNIHHEAMEAQEKQIVDQAIENAFQNGTDWVTEYNNILQERLKKDMRGAEKRMNEIADEMGLDINDIQDLEAVLELMSEERKEKFEAERDAIINGAILPTFFNFMREYLNNQHFAAIFGVPENMSEEAMESAIRGRLNRLSGYELKRLEFAMFDYAVNGKAYGITQLAAIISAKNDGNSKLNKANMVADKPKNKTSNYIYNMFENTPTFFRRAFKKYSLAKVAEFTDAIGFARLRSNVSVADTMSDAFASRVIAKAKEFNIKGLGEQVRLQVYSVLSQVPEGTSKTMWLRALMSNLDLALEADNRFTEAQKSEIREALSVFKKDGRTRNYDAIMAELEQDSDLMGMIDFLRSEFGEQEGGLRDYAEGFLGMKFQSVENYLPFRFRSTGAMTRSLQELTEGNQTLAQAFRAYNVSQANKQAQSTYERNEKAFESKNRYIDLNFLSTVTRAYRENQVKVMTAPDVAYISAMTSESNDSFVNAVPDSAMRGAMRRKVYNYLTDGGSFTSRADSAIGVRTAKALERIKDVTVLYYFGSVVNQLFKQSSAIMNALIEGQMNPFELFITAGQVLSGRLDEGKTKLAEKYDIGQRDVVQDVISATSKSDAITAGGGFFKKNMDRSTFFLRRTDKAAAMASWFSYYESYMRKQGELKGEIDWNELGDNPNDKAAEYATMMVTKDQNINTSRDKSEFNSLNQSKAASIIQMLVMPFANFLLNKKLNMALDYQKAFSDNAENRKEGIKSLGGSILEIAAFHSISQFVIIPMLQAAASGLWGDDEEEDSLFDKEFRMRSFLKGMASDMNPLVMPIGAMESFYAKGVNLLAYIGSGEIEEYSFEDKGFWDGFKAWSKANGLPEFSGAGRDDLSALSFMRQFGVFGDVGVEVTTSLMNIITLGEKNPYMTTAYGSVKYMSPEDAAQARKIEFLKASLIISGGITGLFAKESVQIAKYAERPLTNRGLSSERANIGRILTIDKKLGKELTQEIAYKLKKDNPLSVESMINQVAGQETTKAKVDELASDKYINTIRQIEKMSFDDIRYAGLYAKKIMSDMTPEESKVFEKELMKYLLIKQGQGSMIRVKSVIMKGNE